MHHRRMRVLVFQLVCLIYIFCCAKIDGSENLVGIGIALSFSRVTSYPIVSVAFAEASMQGTVFDNGTAG